MESSGHHVVGIAHLDHVRVREVSVQDRILESAVTIVRGIPAGEVLSGILLVGVVLVPEIGRPGTSLRVIQEGSVGCAGSGVIGVKLRQQLAARENQVAHVARLVGYQLEVGAEARAFRCAGHSMSPGRTRGRTIRVFREILLGCPVHLGHHDGGEVGDRTYLLVPSALELLVIHVRCVGSTAVEPSRIAVHGIADILSRDGVVCVARVIGLVSQTRHQDDVIAILTHHVHYLLEEVMHLLEAAVAAVSGLDLDGLVGQLKHDVGVVAQLGVLSHHLPYGEEVFMILSAHGDIFGANSRRAHHHVEPFVYRIEGHGHKYLIQVFLEPLHAESGDVALAFRMHARLIAPVGIHVLAHEGHLPARGQDLVNLLLVVGQAGIHVIVRPLGTLLVKPGAVSLRETVQVHDVAIVVLEVATIHVQARQRHTGPGLCGCLRQEAEQQ